MSVEPGWYVDPAEPETRRWWDGEGWIGAPIPVDVTPPDGPPPAEPEPTAPTPTSGATPHTGAADSPGHAPTSGAPGQPGHGPGQPGRPGQPHQPGHWPGQPHQPEQWSGPPGPGAAWPGQPGQAGQPGQQGPPPGWPYPQWPGRPPVPRPHGLPLASYGARLVARLIDFGVVFLLNVLVNGWFVWRYFEAIEPYLRETMRRALNGDTSTEGLPQIDDQAGGLQVVILLIATALWFAYEVPSMAARGQTFGKRLARVRALPVETDQPLGFGRAFRRWSTLGLPTLLWYCCGLGLLFQFVDAVSPLFDQPLRQALHDKRAQTVVVQLPRARPDAPTTPRDRADPPGESP
ncbi:RDD family protein [Micromonospora sp. WMMD1128]|uniref:RDD family protein n=1 Tax=Micromonospora sp. WMMD1128 TaxID=3015150 RepID=UPI00248AD088|nr:RDD family protein [Micromonospora sp. WMMD1128]WBB74136.1 RDD family protein [Micromonospora sp. WMMD1128]